MQKVRPPCLLQIILKDGRMAETNGGNSSQSWTSTQAYIMAVLCLLVGCAVGYLLRGSVGGSTPAPADCAAATGHATGRRRAEGSSSRPPEQMKAMADKQAEPLLEQLKSKPNDAALLAQIGNTVLRRADLSRCHRLLPEGPGD